MPLRSTIADEKRRPRAGTDAALTDQGSREAGARGAQRPASGVALWWRGNEGCRRAAGAYLRGRGEVEPERATVWMGVGAAMTGAGDDARRVVVLGRSVSPHRVVASCHRFQAHVVRGSRRPVDEVDVPECAAQDRLDAPVRISVQVLDVDEKISAVDVAHEPGEHRGEIGMRGGDQVYPLSGDGARLVCSLGHALTISAAVDHAQSPKR